MKFEDDDLKDGKLWAALQKEIAMHLLTYQAFGSDIDHKRLYPAFRLRCNPHSFGTGRPYNPDNRPKCEVSLRQLSVQKTKKRSRK